MSTVKEVSAMEFNQIRTWLVSEVGIEIDISKQYLISGRLSKILSDSKLNSYSDLLRFIQQPLNRKLKEQVINAMTTNETYWFRDDKPYKLFLEYFTQTLLPKLESGELPKIKIWSAACSSGQEPYSIGILIHKALLHKPNLLSKIEILATDLDTDKIKEAECGIYSSFSMSRGMPMDLQSRYFKAEGSNFEIKDEIKKMVTFKQANLSQSFVWVGKTEVILMRNVLIYFPVSVKERIFKGLRQIMSPNSALIIGASESVEPFSDLFVAHDGPLGRFYGL